MQIMQDTGEPNGLPEIEAGQYLIDAWMAAGPTAPGAMGEVPLDWPAVVAFAQATGAISEPWEFQAVIDMSRGYVVAKTIGENALAIPPVKQG